MGGWGGWGGGHGQGGGGRSLWGVPLALLFRLCEQPPEGCPAQCHRPWEAVPAMFATPLVPLVSLQDVIQSLFRGQRGYSTTCRTCGRQSGQRRLRNGRLNPSARAAAAWGLPGCAACEPAWRAASGTLPRCPLPPCRAFRPAAESSARSENFYEVDVPVKGHKSLTGEGCAVRGIFSHAHGQSHAGLRGWPPLACSQGQLTEAGRAACPRLFAQFLNTVSEFLGQIACPTLMPRNARAPTPAFHPPPTPVLSPRQSRCPACCSPRCWMETTSTSATSAGTRYVWGRQGTAHFFVAACNPRVAAGALPARACLLVGHAPPPPASAVRSPAEPSCPSACPAPQVDATRQLELRSLPPMLCFSLQRFVFDFHVSGRGGGPYKTTCFSPWRGRGGMATRRGSAPLCADMSSMPAPRPCPAGCRRWIGSRSATSLPSRCRWTWRLWWGRWGPRGRVCTV